MQNIQFSIKTHLIFRFTDYKDFLRFLINSNRNCRGFQCKLAQAAGCKPSHLSGVIRANLHLTPEQTMDLGQSLGLSFIEIEYFLSLVAICRTSNPQFQSHLQRRIETLLEGNNMLTAATIVEPLRQSK